jgi:ankyrin repeat protein
MHLVASQTHLTRHISRTSLTSSPSSSSSDLLFTGGTATGVGDAAHSVMVKWILDLLGVECLSSLNHLGRTPLHLACQAGGIESLEIMVERGGDVAAVASNGDTPLHVCVAEGHIKMTNVLISLGADYDACNKVGRLLSPHYHTPCLFMHHVSILSYHALLYNV